MKIMFYNTEQNRYMSKHLMPCYTVFRGESDIYIETWNVTKIFNEDDSKKWRLDIAYLPHEYLDEGIRQMKINCQCEKNDVTLESLQYITIPKDKFDEYAERDGVVPIER